MLKYSWLLFDADGTLFDFDKSSAGALQSTFESVGIPFSADLKLAYKQINQAAWVLFEAGLISQDELRVGRFRDLFDQFGLGADPAQFASSYLAHLAERHELLEGVEEALERLQGRARMAIITNGLADVQRPRFAKSPILRHFSEVLISEEVGVSKPHPKIFETAFERMGGPKKSEVLMIGDSLTSDIGGGVSYGLDCCWVNLHGATAPESLPISFEIRRLSELADALLEN